MRRGLIRTAGPLDASGKAQLADKLAAIFGSDVQFSWEEQPELIGGFTAQVEGKLYDMSMLSKLQQLKDGAKDHPQHEDEPDFFTEKEHEQLAERMSEGFKHRLDSMAESARVYEYGTVVSCADGVAHIEGLSRSLYGELLEFDGGAYGMALELSERGAGAVLFNGIETVATGAMVRGTGAVVSVPVGEELLGRVVDPLGRPLDGKGLKTKEKQPVERPAPSIMDRAPVSQPMMTGITAIDSMIPIGKGQRELIIGDRQMGKTVIALSAMLNQARQGVVCVYCAIGQKASTIARIIEQLKEKGAMQNCVVVAATASDGAAMQYIAPYAGCTIAEYFTKQGRDALIVYDDLSKHATAYRTMSLLLKRPPGREAYPGDVFYLHSRLLERAAKLSDELGGGSMTALPIVETMAGDISAYIPTNVISITDGQIYLESELFHSGVRPAVNVGLSVSRVGRSAQPKAMRDVSGQLRLKLAQYREMAVFAQFDSDLDANTQKLLKQGHLLTELLKQDQNTVYGLADEIAILVAYQEGLFDGTELPKVVQAKADLLKALHETATGPMSSIDRTGALTDVDKAALLQAMKAHFGHEAEAAATPEAGDEK